MVRAAYEKAHWTTDVHIGNLPLDPEQSMTLPSAAEYLRFSHPSAFKEQTCS